MTYTTFINVAYWAVAGLIVLLAAVIVVLGVSLVVTRSRRYARWHRAYLGRVEARQSRALEDATWFLLRRHEARLAEQIADAKAVVRVVRDARDSRLSLVAEEAI